MASVSMFDTDADLQSESEDLVRVDRHLSHPRLDGGRLPQRRADHAHHALLDAQGLPRQDYIRTARAKGASERSVNFRHAMKNAILPSSP